MNYTGVCRLIDTLSDFTTLRLLSFNILNNTGFDTKNKMPHRICGAFFNVRVLS